MDPNETYPGLPSVTRRVVLKAAGAVAIGGALEIAWVRGTRVVRAQSVPAQYSVATIGVLKGDDGSSAYAINANGDVVGVSLNSASSSSRSTIYRAGKLSDLYGKDAQPSVSWSINKAGHVVGFTTGDPAGSSAVLWDGKKAKVLPTLGGETSQALGINDADVAVGASSAAPGADPQACRWEKGVVTALPVDPGVSVAIDINAKGQIVGSNALSHAVLWDNGDATDLGTLGGDVSLARTINASGKIAGHSATVSGVPFGTPGTHAFLWNQGAMTDLGSLPIGDLSFAWDINGHGVVAGTSVGAAVIWQDGAIVNLNDLIPADSGWVLTGAYGINEAGQIAGTGQRKGKNRGFLLTPIKP